MAAPAQPEDTDLAATPPGRAYAGPDVTVYFDGTRCRHYAECIRGLPQVFDVSHRPWIQADAAPADEPTPDGPLLVRGVLRLAPADGDGPWADETRMAACSCGRTSNRPFCSGACQDGSAQEDA